MALNNTGTEAKYNTVIQLDGSVGVVGNFEKLSCAVETLLRVEVTGVGPTNQVQIYGRLRSSQQWHYIATVNGAITGTADIATYDNIRYFVTVADGVGTLVASGFIFPSSASTAGSLASIDNTLQTINAPTTILTEAVGSITYIGEAEVGTLTSEAKWLLRKVDSTGPVVSVRYVTPYFDQVWDDRASLIYV